MKRSDSITELAKALTKFNTEATKVVKDGKNPHLKNSYATIDAIMETIRPILAKHGLNIMQFVEGDGAQIQIKTLLLHESGEWMESEPLTLRPEKMTAQGLGSATTYGRRYSLTAFLGLATGDEDDDGNAASGTKPASDRKIEERQERVIFGKAGDLAKREGTTKQGLVNGLVHKMGVKDIKELSYEQAERVIGLLKQKLGE